MFALQTISHMKVVAFQGNNKGGVKMAEPVSLPVITQHDLMSSPDVPLAIMKRKLMKTNDIDAAHAHLQEIKAHLQV